MGWFKQRLTQLAGRPGPAVAPAVPPVPPALLAKRIAQCKALMIGQQVQEARDALDALLQSNPGDADVLAHLGACDYLLGDVAGAIEPLAAAVRIDGEHAFAFKFLAACLEVQRDDAHALAITRTAARLNADDAEVLCVAAALHLRLGMLEEAARYINQALTRQPESRVALDLLEVLAKRAVRARATFEGSPKIAQARARLQQRLLVKHKKHGLADAELATLLRFLEATRDSFPSALAIAEQVFQSPPVPSLLIEPVASVFSVAGRGAEVLQLRAAQLNADADDLYARLAMAAAQIMLRQGAWREAWAETTRALVRLRPEAHPNNVPLWQGARLGKGKLLVYQDQGIGDALLALRTLPHLAARGIRFDVWVLPTLADLLPATLGYQRLIDAPELPDPSVIGCVAAVPLLGLIPALDLQLADLQDAPPLALPGDLPAALRAHLPDGPGVSIGLVYGGNPIRPDDWLRSVPASALRSLAAIAGIRWVNLVLDARDDRAAVSALFALNDPMPHVQSFQDTAAIIQRLDAVIAIDSSVAHLAAALGKKTWVLAPSMLDWRWQMGDIASPWWPAVTLLRSTAPGQWDASMARLVQEVSAFVTQKQQSPADP